MSRVCELPEGVCLGHPELPEGWTDWATALHAEPSWYGEWRRTEPVVRAESLGHVMADDPTHDLSSVSRATCRKCGASVLLRNETIWGSAVEKECSG